MVIFVLLMTVVTMLFVGHGLYYQVFVKCMSPWQADMAAWILSCGIETTVLVITANVKYFSSKQLPIFFAICSGFIVLFFIDAFNTTQPILDIAVRWFIGAMVCGLNYVYSELFVKKFNDELQATDMIKQIETLKQENEEYNRTISLIKSELSVAKEDSVKLLNQLVELEEFKRREIEKVTCKCGQVFTSIYKLAAHKATCSSNPNKGQKVSAFDDVPSNRIRVMK
ncbi:MAG TPA: hypothetical protein DGG95_09200 [Cytophagales bacterium]|nr:hypothetical protein [Cytophagales bacterium]